MISTPPVASEAASHTRPLALRSLLLGAAGVMIEWYDFAIYLYMAPVLGRLFVPAGDPRAQLLMAYGIFATGYFVRPLGALFYGALGDRLGRKRTLITSALLMSACKAVEALLPTYASVGLWAPALLIIMRMASGFSMGGEYAGTFVFLLEHAPPARRGFICSFANTMCAAGIAVCSLVVAGVNLLGPEVVAAWAWRVPFAVGALLGLVAMEMRVSMDESPRFSALLARGEVAQSPVQEAVRRVPRQIALATVLAAWIATTYHVFVALIPSWLTAWCGVAAPDAALIASAASLLNVLVMPWPALLGDIIGRRRLLGAAAGLIGVLALPLFWLMASGYAMAGALLAVPVSAAVNASAATLAVELFPTRVRFTGFAIGFNLGSIAGGVAPVLSAWLIGRSGLATAPALLPVAASLLALGALWALPATRADDDA